MRCKTGIAVLVSVFLIGCAKTPSKGDVVLKVNDYEVTVQEFTDGFKNSPYAFQDDKSAAKEAYLENLIRQKLIVQDAVKKNLDKESDFLKSIERFWEQSLVTVALGAKTKEIQGSLKVTDDAIRRLYDQMVKEGVTTKTYEEMYPQMKWQAERQLESKLLGEWMEDLRKEARIEISQDYFMKARQ